MMWIYKEKDTALFIDSCAALGVRIDGFLYPMLNRYTIYFPQSKENMALLYQFHSVENDGR